MLELPSLPFVSVVTELRSLIFISNGMTDKNEPVSGADRSGILTQHMARLTDALNKTGARSALASANRLRSRIDNADMSLNHGELNAALVDTESRFMDHLSDIKLFVMGQQEAGLLEPSDNLLGFSGVPVDGFSSAFPNASFEIEEAAKCIAFERYTASVFHCMRAMEFGIKAIAKFLDIPDPAKPVEKNWGVILKTINDAMDSKYPKNARLPKTTGATLELLYANLDAIKNPWRNATMHVENVYAPHEALHIARCVGMFLLELLKLCYDNGVPQSSSTSKSTVC
jgi:hypothetical protein